MGELKTVTREEFQKFFDEEYAKLENAYAGSDMSMLGGSWFECTACQATIRGTLSAAIAAALATGVAEAMAIIALATNLAIEIVVNIIEEFAQQGIMEALNKVIYALCKAMTFCD